MIWITPNDTFRMATRRHWNARFETVVVEDTSGLSELHVTCDGSANSHSSGYGWYESLTGSWAAGGSTRQVHNNAAYTEAHAILNAIENLPEVDVLHIYSDCQNVITAFQRLLQGEPVKYRGSNLEWAGELLKAATLVAGRTVHPHWVKGHSSNTENKIADYLANWARKRAVAQAELEKEAADQIIERLLKAKAYAQPSFAAA